MTDKVYIGIIIVLILVAGYLAVSNQWALNDAARNLDQEGRQLASDSVKRIYDLQYETESKIVNVDEINGNYQVTVEFTDYTNKVVTQDVFVTKDGKLLTERFLIVDRYVAALGEQKQFAECMYNRGLRILGKSDDTATLQQLTVLGNYAYKLFVSCDGSNEATCKSLGVNRYPTTVYNNTGYDNIYAPVFFSQLTGCAVNITQA